MSTREEKDLLVMKIIHYFITERNYNPVVVHGIQNEVWLENMGAEPRIVRIVLNYIHNKEQFDFDQFKVNRLTRQIKLKTFTFKLKVLSFYIDVNEDLELTDTKINTCIRALDEKMLQSDKKLKKFFPDISKKLVFNEEGIKLYEKINNDILKKNIDQSEKINELFREKKPIVTKILITIIIALFIIMYLFGSGSEDIKTLYVFGALVKNGSWIRLFVSMFLHIGILHLLMNVYSLYILGKQTENFYGHIKTLIIFIYSGLVGNLLSMILMNPNTISAGASGAIFGLMGALLYFSINQRSYMGEALKKQILPVIIINLLFTFMIPSINMYAHLGGLIGGIIISMAVGVKYKTSKFEKINALLAASILIVFLTYLAYFK